jgi:hypothetical protein
MYVNLTLLIFVLFASWFFAGTIIPHCNSNSFCKELGSMILMMFLFTFTLHMLYTVYKGCLQSLWTSHITLSRYFVEVRRWFLFHSTSLVKWCTFYSAPPTSWEHAADHWSLRNFWPLSSHVVVGRAQKSHGVRSELNFVYSLEKWIGGTPLEHLPYSPDLTPMWFLDFSNHEKGAPRWEILKWSTVCNTFLRSGWSVVRSASLAKGGTLKKRPSLHLHKVPTCSNKVSPRTLPVTLVYQEVKTVFTVWKFLFIYKCVPETLNFYLLNWNFL